MMTCHFSDYRVPAVVDLGSIKVRLTAYSLRCDKHGTTDWNLGACAGGIECAVLHRARNDTTYCFDVNRFT